MRLLVSGTTCSLRRILPTHGERLGFLTSPSAGNKIATIISFGLPWAIDNGAFSGFDDGAFRRLMARAKGAPGLLWVVCPDVVAHAGRTMDRFREWEPELRANGFRVALVGQDGMEYMNLPWHQFDAFFVGGSTRWKLSQAAGDLSLEAKRRGKYLHMGRVNSFRRLRAAFDLGCDSVDGTGMSRWGDRHLAKFCYWLKSLEEQPILCQ